MRFSIPVRIFVGFTATLACYGALVWVGLQQREGASRAAQVLTRGYFPTISCLEGVTRTQTMVLSALGGTGGPVAVPHLRVLRRQRTSQLETCLKETLQLQQLLIHTGFAKDPAAHHIRSHVSAAIQIGRELELVHDRWDEKVSSGLLVGKPNSPAALNTSAELKSLRQRERLLARELAVSRERAISRFREISHRSTATQEDFSRFFTVLSIISIVVGLIVLWWSYRLLLPLTRLQRRVTAVTRGDFSREFDVPKSGELGQLEIQFERMVMALSARDQRLREAAQATRALQERLILSERLAAVGQMAAHVAHEVRNPLSSIGLNMELLAEDAMEFRPENAQLVHSVQREIERLSQITDDYLNLARQPSPVLSPTDVGALLREITDFMAAEMRDTGVTLDLSVSEDLPIVGLDRDQFRQAMVNLLRNAQESMVDGGQVQLSASKTRVADTTGEGRGAVEVLEIQVVDHGTGMDESTQRNLFDPFYTTKERGTGLGLPLTRQIIAAHGGSILCRSKPGEGTMFVITLPTSTTQTS